MFIGSDFSSDSLLGLTWNQQYRMLAPEGMPNYLQYSVATVAPWTQEQGGGIGNVSEMLFTECLRTDFSAKRAMTVCHHWPTEAHTQF